MEIFKSLMVGFSIAVLICYAASLYSVYLQRKETGNV